MTKVILINGPKNSGKDTIGKALCEAFNNNGLYAECMKFAEPIKSAIAAFFKLTPAECYIYFETDTKNYPSARFLGKTPREVCISFSEDWAKMLFGVEIFGTLFIHNSNKFNDVIFATDSGFDDETNPTIAHFGAQNVAVIRLHREGLDFTGDSRGYIDPKNVWSLDLTTDIPEQESINLAIKFVTNFLSTEGA